MGFINIINSFIISIKKDFLTLVGRKGKGQFNPDVFVNPAKYAQPLSMKKIVADSKVSREGVGIYKKKIELGEKIDPIIVVKHPRKDIYAVLDGHHRYFAYKELHSSEICASLAGDYSSVIFFLTENGYFQPSAQVTKNIRQPAKHVHENLKQFLEDFFSGESIKSYKDKLM